MKTVGRINRPTVFNLRGEGVEMSMDLTFILRGYEISNTAKVVYGLLDGLSKASAARGKPYTYISRRSIAERCGVCEKTARTAIKQLKSVGLIAEKRMGQGLNNHIFVFLPKETQEEKAKTVDAADHSIYQSRTVNMTSANTNTQKVIKNNKDISILPANDDKGHTPPKGRPTPKRTKINVNERQKMRKQYRDYFRNRLKYDEYRRDGFISYEDSEAMAKTIDLMANTMAGKGQIFVNGALITPQQWYYVVKNIEQEQVISIISSIHRWQNVRKPQAYLLSCLYNAALQNTLLKPWENNAI